MTAKLLVIGGPAEGKVFTIMDDSECTIGRGESANCIVEDPTVSRAHCVIEYFESRAVLRDNGSKTGTRVNGKPLTDKVELAGEEVISVGTTKIRFQIVPTISRLPALVAPPPAPLVEELTPDHEELRALSNTTLAHFEIYEAVGLGKSGVVFRANDFKEKREVALKVYVPEFAENDEALQRFIRAVKTMLPMRHSNVVTLYGGGKTGPYCWMSMEYVDGESLKETIARIGKGGKIDWKPALRVAIDINCGLHYIHSEKIIHRNLSPGNILFSRTGQVKLGSLILAKALSGALAKDVTVGGNIPGETRFLAPEQVGGGGVVDGRADIYSLGVLVYAMLTGRVPFEGSTPMQTATWILTRDPTAPRRINPSIPDAVEKIVLKMLAKKPEHRYQNAAELIAALEQLPKIYT